MFNIIIQIVIILIIFLCAMGAEECGDGGEDCIEVEVGQCVIFVDKDGEEIDD